MSLGQHIELASRRVDTREIGQVHVFCIEDIDAHLKENLDVVKRQFQIADDLLTKGEQEAAADIWRSQVVFIESALDFYLHEVIKLGIISIYNATWNGEKTIQYNNLTFRMEELELACDSDDDDWLAQWIDKKYSTETYMNFEKLEQVCKLLGLDKHKIAKVFYEQGSDIRPIKKLEKYLNRMYRRRNIIAHQAGRQSATAEKITITKEDVVELLDKIECILQALSNEVRDKIMK